jgi:hypothetical protein
VSEIKDFCQRDKTTINIVIIDRIKLVNTGSTFLRIIGSVSFISQAVKFTNYTLKFIASPDLSSHEEIV